ncbi:unnamed protein product [Adineta steineri]|uniref:Uncharacterized protein n=2 Tax=Adineta steineri TaxID=433720 RepID=A0A814PGB1_9BILA|nr:unnamed protein product [Adineta steineri]
MYLANISHEQMSCSTYSSLSRTSTNKSKTLHKSPNLIQLCMNSDENYACCTIKKLFSTSCHYSLNLCDQFGCNILMYSLRYQRYRLFDILLNEISFDLNIHTKDQENNTILHYAILYGGNNTQIIEKLIEKYKKFAMNIDERNSFGFTPLLLAAFCGRYDLVLTFLTKTDASPFVRDSIQFKNLFDYIKHDNQPYTYSNPKLKHLRIQLQQTIPSRQYTYKNFFEIISLQTLQNELKTLRFIIMELFNVQYLSSNMIHLLSYLHERYPRIQIQRQQQDNIIATQLITQGENSKVYIHNILNIFDPDIRPKIPLKLPTIQSKKSTRFKKVGTKITTLTAFSHMSQGKKQSLLKT